MNEETTARDIMTTEIISVTPDDTLVTAANTLSTHHFAGVPVIDSEQKLVGILTEYDLLESAVIHMPTFQVILRSSKVFPEDREHLEKEIQKINSFTVRDIMNTDPLVLAPETPYKEVIDMFVQHHRVNPIPVVDRDKKVLGVISRYDVLKPLRTAGA